MRQRRSRRIIGQTKSGRSVTPIPLPRSRSNWRWTQASSLADVRRLLPILPGQLAVTQELSRINSSEYCARGLQRFSIFGGILGAGKGLRHADGRRGMPCRDGTAPQKLLFNVVSTLVRVAGEGMATITRLRTVGQEVQVRVTQRGRLAPVRVDVRMGIVSWPRRQVRRWAPCS
jgi:hypothetical protein